MVNLNKTNDKNHSFFNLKFKKSDTENKGNIFEFRSRNVVGRSLIEVLTIIFFR